MLTLNNFVLNCISYLQTEYCAMRTICLSPYAIIFMKEFQTKYIRLSMKHVPITYFCYIDDIFMIRTGNSWETSNTFCAKRWTKLSKNPDNEDSPQNLFKEFIETGYKQMEQMKKADLFKREDLLNTRKNTKNEKKSCVNVSFQ